MIKICGLSRPEDIDAVNRALPDYIGFVFAPSRRRVDIETAAALKKRLDARINTVGVFVNESVDTVVELFHNGVIDLAQLHGDEDAGYIRRLKNACGCKIIKAIGIDSSLNSLPPQLQRRQASVASMPDYYLFDTVSGNRGGSGEVFDWTILKEYRGIPYFLAGGLSARNVAEAIRVISPYCVDVSSGVETDGKKDTVKIDAFVHLVRGISIDDKMDINR